MQTNQDMQMVWHAVDRKHSAALILYNAGDVFVDLFLMSRGNEGLPAFNGENELDDYLCIRVRHWACSLRFISTKTYCSPGARLSATRTVGGVAPERGGVAVPGKAEPFSTAGCVAVRPLAEHIDRLEFNSITGVAIAVAYWRRSPGRKRGRPENGRPYEGWRETSDGRFYEDSAP